MSDEAPTLLKAYTFHGLSLKTEGDNARGMCPFCEKEDHFFVAIKTGQYNCRRCQNEGNLFTFLKNLYEVSLIRSTAKNQAMQRLAADRGLDIQEMVRWGVAVSIADDSFLLPMYNTKGALANLARIVKVDGKWRPYTTPTCKLHPFMPKGGLQKQQTTRWWCEGPWDAIALSFVLRNVRGDSRRWVLHTGDQAAIKTNGVLAVPGAGTFNPEWLFYFSDENIFTYDNDHPRTLPNSQKKSMPGWDGMNRVVRIANEETHSGKSLKLLVWGPGGYDVNLADGYDIRDLSREKSPVGVMSYLCSHLSNNKLGASSPGKNGSVRVEQRVEPLECKSFQELCQHFDQPKHLMFTDNFRRTLAVSLATVISTPLPDEQLWFRVIGPPSSGKTTIAECISAAEEYCFASSILTGLHSGVRAQHAVGRAEPSLVPQMDGKCVVIKDADTLIQTSNRDKILSELRDIYDGSTRARYRTGKTQQFFDHRSSFLLCGTDKLRGLNRTFLGERFLDCDILGDSSARQYLSTAVNSAFSVLGESLAEVPKTNEAKGAFLHLLKRITYGFLKHQVHRLEIRDIKIPTHTQTVCHRLESMAQLLSYARARIERGQGEELLYRTRTDVGARLGKQFVKLAVCLALVFDKPSIDSDIMEIVAKVFNDTATGFNYEIIQYLHASPHGRETWQMENELGLSASSVRRICNDLQELNIICRRLAPNKSGSGGRDAHKFFLTDEVRDLFRTSGV